MLEKCSTTQYFRVDHNIVWSYWIEKRQRSLKVRWYHKDNDRNEDKGYETKIQSESKRLQRKDKIQQKTNKNIDEEIKVNQNHKNKDSNEDTNPKRKGRQILQKTNKNMDGGIKVDEEPIMKCITDDI
jgi:anion-transporting  ArsA/GET3 family ATPase